MLREVKEVGRSGGHTAEVEGGRTGIRPIASSIGDCFSIACAVAEPIDCTVARVLEIEAGDSHGPDLGEVVGDAVCGDGEGQRSLWQMK